MQSVRQLPLPFIPDDDEHKVLKDVVETVRQAHERMYDDIRLGLGSYKVDTAIPATDDLEIGQPAFYASGGTNYICTRITNQIYKVALA